MNVPTEEVASKATKLLKSEVKQVLNDEVNKLDENFLRKVFGIATAALVAVSAYAYIVWKFFQQAVVSSFPSKYSSIRPIWTYQAPKEAKVPQALPL